jgi:hypothetical protein
VAGLSAFAQILGLGALENAGGANFVMADCAARFINEEVDEITYRAISTKAGSETGYDAL